ncbi:myophilin-like [Acanthaster planci]|uniref:Myophilin-like n=1 Tax=Acanthaster planci TaxID=133434 RepID=A0A8B7XNC7_ACAPL|nr:myophilin-like [Acanthaster planci]
MANVGPAYGDMLARKKKIEGKRDAQQEHDMMIFIQERTGSNDIDVDNIECLKDGKILCELINGIIDNKVKCDQGNAPFKMRANVESFIEGCKRFGLKEQELFQVNDLFEGKNLPQFTQCIYAIGRKLQMDPCYCGPILGPKQAAENKRHFSQEQLDAGKHIHSLQMGSNKGATQAGQNFGAPRQIILQMDPCYCGPILGPKQACGEKREWTQEQLDAGKHIHSLQMGSNKGATQAGQNFGAPRQIIN